MQASTGGTSYSGGNGTAGFVRCNAGAVSVAGASSTSGGSAHVYDSNSRSYYWAGGGAGVKGGSSSHQRQNMTNAQSAGGTGTGGLLILYANSLQNEGQIVSNGTAGAGFTARYQLYGSYNGPDYAGAVGGGGSRWRFDKHIL